MYVRSYADGRIGRIGRIRRMVISREWVHIEVLCDYYLSNPLNAMIFYFLEALSQYFLTISQALMVYNIIYNI